MCNFNSVFCCLLQILHFSCVYYKFSNVLTYDCLTFTLTTLVNGYCYYTKIFKIKLYSLEVWLVALERNFIVLYLVNHKVFFKINYQFVNAFLNAVLKNAIIWHAQKTTKMYVFYISLYVRKTNIFFYDKAPIPSFSDCQIVRRVSRFLY